MDFGSANCVGTQERLSGVTPVPFLASLRPEGTALGRSILRGFFVFVSVIVALGAAMLLYRAWRQHENELAYAIPNGIEEGSFVRIGGIDQWIQIRGENRANPV